MATLKTCTYFPSAALIPPCAATVCDRVGKSFDIQAVLKPASARPKAARRPAPPAPTTIASYSWSITGYFREIKPEASFALRCSVAKMRAAGRVDEKALAGVRKLLESWWGSGQPLIIYCHATASRSRKLVYEHFAWDGAVHSWWVAHASVRKASVA
jgi:hypothetical protein